MPLILSVIYFHIIPFECARHMIICNKQTQNIHESLKTIDQSLQHPKHHIKQANHNHFIAYYNIIYTQSLLILHWLKTDIE